MKFTDGYWRKRDGLTVVHPAHHLDSAPGPDSLTVYAATRRIHDRGDTLDAPLITVTLTAPTDPALDCVSLVPVGPNGVPGWPVELLLSDHDELLSQGNQQTPAEAMRSISRDRLYWASSSRS